MQHNSKVKATNENCIISLHGYYLLPCYLSFADQRESRTTLHQGREDDEHMGTSYMTFQKSAQFSWKELLSRIKQTHAQVNANLSSYHHVEHMAALSSPLLLVELRYHMKKSNNLWALEATGLKERVWRKQVSSEADVVSFYLWCFVVTHPYGGETGHRGT